MRVRGEGVFGKVGKSRDTGKARGKGSGLDLSVMTCCCKLDD
jgi:hypothetical protein